MTNLAATARNDNARSTDDDDPVRVGQTIEISHYRIHRYRDSFVVTDVTNAGKRGKACLELHAQSKSTRNDSRYTSLGSGDAAYALIWARRGVDFEVMAEKMRESNDVSVRQLRAVDVTPNGAKVEVITTRLVATFEPSEFSIKDATDFHNEETVISLDRKRDTRAAHKWAITNREKLETMGFRDVVSAFRDLGIEFHRYCAMD
jgi:hypothetical protein